MTDRGLVVHQQALHDIAESLRTSTDDIRSFLLDLFEAVDQQTAGWSEETPSRQAQRRFERRLDQGVTALTAALDGIAKAVDAHRERAQDAEVENVAIVG